MTFTNETVVYSVIDVVGYLVFLDTAAVVKMVMFEFISLINSILTLNLNIKLYSSLAFRIQLWNCKLWMAVFVTYIH